MPRFYGNVDYGQFLDRFFQAYGAGLQTHRYQSELERQRRQDALAELAQERLLEEQRQTGMREKRMQELAEGQARREAALDQPLWSSEQPPETVQPPLRPVSIPGPSLRTLGLLHGAGVKYQLPPETLARFGLTGVSETEKIGTIAPGHYPLLPGGRIGPQAPPLPEKVTPEKAPSYTPHHITSGKDILGFAFNPQEGTFGQPQRLGEAPTGAQVTRDRAADVAQMNALQRQFDQQASILLRQAGLSPTETKTGELDLGALFATKALSDPRYKELNQKLANLWDSYYSKISELSGIKVDNPFREAKPDIRQTINTLLGLGGVPTIPQTEPIRPPVGVPANRPPLSSFQR